MLHAVTEGFAQANMVSSRAATVERDDRVAGDASSSRIDSGRFTTNVTGRSAGESLGYNLSVDGVHGQTSGFGLAGNEVQARRARIQRGRAPMAAISDKLTATARNAMSLAFKSDGK